MPRRTRKLPDDDLSRCPICGCNWEDKLVPDMPFSDACWVAMRVLAIMKENDGPKTRKLIERLGTRIWEVMLFAIEEERQRGSENDIGNIRPRRREES